MRDYYQYLKDPTEESRSLLRDNHADAALEADREAWCHELSEQNNPGVFDRVSSRIGGATDWVLIGGPPCQAYSLAGRSRRANEERVKFESDPRHTLYRHYIEIIDEFRPAVFVMENVKGLLSARLSGKPVFNLIRDDLSIGGDYTVSSLVCAENDGEAGPRSTLIESELYGIPQRRHRVILVGVRNGRGMGVPSTLKRVPQVPISNVLGGLPELRSGFSARSGALDNEQAWLDHVVKQSTQLEILCDSETQTHLKQARSLLTKRGAPIRNQQGFLPGDFKTESYSTWYRRDSNLAGIYNHESRSHMPSDITRYLFCACFTAAHGVSPKLKDFPQTLLPAHKSAALGVSSGHYSDRFRAQPWGLPATTITSHISKDGHYFIHPDPLQARSLSVREAARIQTFPDDYFFEGSRTQQYHQVGNAVPPLLAIQISKVIAEVLGFSGSEGVPAG